MCCTSLEEAASLNKALVRYDSGYYLTIARDGYSADGSDRAFFPLYPYAVRWLAGISGLDVFGAGLALSAISFLACALLLFTIIQDYADRSVALATVASLLFFPLAFFGFAFYAEAVFLAFGLAAVLLARRGKFVLSGACVALACMTRPAGWLLAIPLVIESVNQRDWRPRRVLALGVGGLIAPLGMFVSLYSIPFEHQTWRLWEPYSELVRTEWKSYITWPWMSIIDASQALLFGTGISPDWFARAITAFELLLCLVALFSLVVCRRVMPLSLYLYMLCSILYYLAYHGPYGYGLEDFPRHLFVVFPFYAFFSAVVWQRRKTLFKLWLGTSILMLMILSAWFGSGRWVS